MTETPTEAMVEAGKNAAGMLPCSNPGYISVVPGTVRSVLSTGLLDQIVRAALIAALSLSRASPDRGELEKECASLRKQVGKLYRVCNERDVLKNALVPMLEIFGKPQPEEYVDGGASYKLACDTVARARAALNHAGASSPQRSSESAEDLIDDLCQSLMAFGATLPDPQRTLLDAARYYLRRPAPTPSQVREECARVAENFRDPNPYPTVYAAIAAAIRSLNAGETPGLADAPQKISLQSALNVSLSSLRRGQPAPDEGKS